MVEFIFYASLRCSPFRKWAMFSGDAKSLDTVLMLYRCGSLPHNGLSKLLICCLLCGKCSLERLHSVLHRQTSLGIISRDCLSPSGLISSLQYVWKEHHTLHLVCLDISCYFCIVLFFISHCKIAWSWDSPIHSVLQVTYHHFSNLKWHPACLWISYH